MNKLLSAASEITCAFAAGTFLWGLPLPAAGLALVGVSLALYRRHLQGGMA